MKYVKDKVRKWLGVFLIVFGCIGLILPILPGWWVIIIGLEILGWRLVVNRKLNWREMIRIEVKKDKEREENV